MQVLIENTPAFRRTLGWHVQRTLTLALPVMGARAGLMLMITIDSIMAGQASGDALAHYGIALAPHIFLLVVGIGFLVGTVVLVGQADGAGEPERCGAIWHSSLLIALLMGALAGLVMAFGPSVLTLMGQDSRMAAGGGAALRGFAPGMPAILLFLTTSFLLEGLGRPRAGMTIALLANLPNAALNWALIGGHLGLPALGAEGATLATSITRWLMFLALLAYVLRLPDRHRYALTAPRQATRATVGRLFRLGTPLAVATGLESGTFTMLATFAGWLGTTQMAAYQSCINVVSFTFMLALGVSTATSVRVANAVGRDDRSGLEVAGWVGMALATLLMLLLGLLVLWQRDAIAMLYSDAAAVQAVAREGLLLVVAVLFFDGIQATLMGAHRGAADVAIPTAMLGVAFWVVGVPAAYVLGVHEGHGVPGLLTGLMLGLVAASVLLTVRFAWLARQPVRRFA
jgi:MATE family multidrug resistance protein